MKQFILKVMTAAILAGCGKTDVAQTLRNELI